MNKSTMLSEDRSWVPLRKIARRRMISVNSLENSKRDCVGLCFGQSRHKLMGESTYRGWLS